MPFSLQGKSRRFRYLATIITVSGMAAWLLRLNAAPAEPEKANAGKPRLPWTTSRVVGSPDPPPPFKVVRAFPNVKFNNPVLMSRWRDRFFVGEFAGVLYSFRDVPDAKAELFMDLRKELKTMHLLSGAEEVEAVYGLAFHPDFEQNRQCFVCYVLKGNRRLAEGTRVSRFTVTRDDPPRIDPASEEIVLTFLGGGHNGGDLHFGPDGMLYVSTGDGAGPNPPDPLNTGQDLSDLLSSILRIDVDRKDPGKNYAVPKSNPFVGMADARPEVWAYGFRNPWRMSFDRQTGELFVGDVGWELWEMIHRVARGGNYGWSAMEGPQPIKPDKAGPTPIHPALIELPHTVACSVTGGLVYRGKRFPELYGAYVFGDWETRRLWAARFDGDRVVDMPEITRPSVRIVAFGEDENGEIYLLDHEAGTIHALERNDAAGQNAGFPTKLSETGLFTDVRGHTPAPGVVPFQVNSPQWLDGATAEHWVAFPDLSFATLHATPRPIPGMVYWHNFRMHFPKDAVLLRTLALGARRVETQLLHYDGLDWRPYVFAWRDDQTDADLVPADGAETTLFASDRDRQSAGSSASGGAAKVGGPRLWQYQSRSQCMLCHNNQSEYAIAFLPEQLNRPGPDGRNQLVALTEAGYVRRVDGAGKALPAFDEAAAAREKKLADPTDPGQPLEARARAYLHGNCGHCHFEHGGGTVPLRLQFNVPTAEMQAIDVRPTRGDFGLRDARIIHPGKPWSSTLYYRMAKFGRDRMPHVGSERPDEAGLKLIEDWITSLGPNQSNSLDLAGALDQALAEPRTAMLAARMLGREQLKPAEREQLLNAAKQLPTSAMRDLFDGFFPEGQPGDRKLGSNPRPRAILALRGDAARGEKLFWSETLKCGNCHVIGERGTAVGPELTSIGKLRTRDDLLQSILEPSRRIEPKFATYVAQTTDGRVFTGLLAKRDENEVILRDGENRLLALLAKQVEALRPVRQSLMPDNQLASMTAQEAADLLEFLVGRR